MNLLYKLKYILCLVCIPFILQPLTVQAQMPSLAKTEFILKDKDELPYVISLKDKGLLYFNNESEKTGKNQLRWIFTKSDTTLTKVWEESYLLDENLIFKGYYIAGDQLFLLFGRRFNSDHTIMRLNHLQGGDLEVFNIYALLNMDLSEFEGNNEDAYLAGKVNNRPVVIHYSYNTRQSRVLPSVYGLEAEISDLKVDQKNGDLHLVIAYRKRNKSKVFIKTYHKGGVLGNEVQLESPKDKNLLGATLATTDQNKLMAIGTYAGKGLEYPQGFYITAVESHRKQSSDNTETGEEYASEAYQEQPVYSKENKEAKFIKYHKFTDYENFFNHLKPARQERVKKRIFKKREKGKELQIRYRFMLHDIEIVNDKLLLIAEAYYPQYRSEGTGPYGTNISGTRIFDGYRFTHTLLCMFDGNGETIWNNSMAIEPIISFTLEPQVEVAADENQVSVFYKSDKSITGRILHNGKFEEEKPSFLIRSQEERKAGIQYENISLKHWYGPNYIVFGNQHYSRSSLSNFGNGNIKNELFFINKFSGDQIEKKAQSARIDQ